MRPSKDEYFLAMAQLIAERGTCARRKVGCVLVNARGHVLSTGYNGVASGFKHCNENSECPGAQSASGTNLDKCGAIHAEQNALLQCRDPYEIHTCYTTTSCCTHCVKLLLNTSCQRIVFLEEYPHEDPKELWSLAGREWIKGDSRYKIHLKLVTN